MESALLTGFDGILPIQLKVFVTDSSERQKHEKAVMLSLSPMTGARRLAGQAMDHRLTTTNGEELPLHMLGALVRGRGRVLSGYGRGTGGGI